MTKRTALELETVRRCFGSVVAVDNVSLAVAPGEFVTLLGPSGSGKTSTLRLIGGFEELDAGAIRIKGERVDHLPPYRRDTATIFQSGALFPHKTVAENVAYGLRMRKVDRPERDQRIRQALDIVRLQGYEHRYPSQLSGGQKQRVALARSLVVRPAILLFDEPLSALDLSLRLQLRGEIKRLHDELEFSAIYVTHDQGEAMAMSSRVAVMNKGGIEQIDRPETIFHDPANEFVFTFIGESCCFPVRRAGGEVTDRQGHAVALTLKDNLPQGEARLYIRPSRLKLASEAAGLPNRLKATIHFIEFLGDVHRYHLKAGALEVFADHAGTIGHAVGDLVEVGWRSEDMKVFR
ncbi:ABC transporter ATP-binding protein [Nordella sp. HKS 07]|uniref:ABC transporter ATP-binding protein n=1 Tax=Nordella sp. HKS 07 TaxID=2712222 RepID=UPI0013E19901|nr:ABC transporter ATP-binding protein [Nordella sp. HKS 07]QIG49821.1 ABC transporter ATP-binding protein [Nordella sp. HKS 07]